MSAKRIPHHDLRRDFARRVGGTQGECRLRVDRHLQLPLRRHLAHAGLEADEIVGGTDAPRAKPAPDMVLLACERLGVGTGEVLFVGDSRYDREAAGAAGVRFVGLGIDGDLRIEALGELEKLALAP